MWCAYDEGEVVHKFYICMTTDYGREGWVSYKIISLLAQEYNISPRGFDTCSAWNQGYEVCAYSLYAIL